MTYKCGSVRNKLLIHNTFSRDFLFKENMQIITKKCLQYQIGNVNAKK